MFVQIIARPNNQRNFKKMLWYVIYWQKEIRHAQTQTQTQTIYRWWQTQIRKHCLFHILFILQIHWWCRMQITWLAKLSFSLSLLLKPSYHWYLELFLFLFVLFITPHIAIYIIFSLSLFSMSVYICQQNFGDSWNAHLHSCVFIYLPPTEKSEIA